MKSAPSLSNADTARPVPQWVRCLMWCVVSGLLLYFEGRRWLDPEQRAAAMSGWMSGEFADFFPFLPFVLLFPLAWWGWRVPVRSKKSSAGWRAWLASSPGHDHSLFTTWVVACLVSAFAFGVSWKVGQRFDHLPPAYHDEYSYLIQAQTYLHGRWSNPEFAPRPELFDQMHVLNEGVFASRYFPATGAWMAPFVAVGNPWLGHQLAQALCALLLFWTGRELSNNGTGLLAGLLFAVSPGVVLFSNLLLAHHPTMLGLCLFLWAILGAKRTGQLRMYLIAGAGLSFAMLCRPMTAAGFALPFGVLFFVWWFTGRGRWMPRGEASTLPAFRQRSLRAVMLGLPLLIGFGIVFYSNKQITGDALLTPYQKYLDVYTPRHVYGFNNVIRGEQKLGPKVLEGYDGWAQNLTPALAWKNLQTRICNSLRWTFGILPLTAAVVVILCAPRTGKQEWLFIPAAILSLHVAHIPYWFEGIMGWHYVFETAPLWVLMLAEVTRRLCMTWQSLGRPAMCGCWFAMLGVSLLARYVTVPPLWPAQMDRAVIEVKYPRQQYAQFRQQVDTIRNGQPAIVFVLPNPDDISMDYVTNSAALGGPVLVARLQDRSEYKAARKLFPDRLALLFNARTHEFERVDDR